MGSRRLTTWGAIALALLWTASAAAQDMRIQFAEKVAIAAAPGQTAFDAYGRRFALELESNERLLRSLPSNRKAQLAGARLLRGKLAGIAGSWVRIARVGDGLEGAIWDGHDLYGITTRARIDAQLTTPLDAAPLQTVIYRLSDAIGGLDRQFCAVEPARAASLAGPTPLEQYKAMVGEIRAQAAAGTVTDQIEISIIGDASFQSQLGSNAMAEMIARLNIADGIFSEQVGILILATDVRLLSGIDPFSSNDPVTLLGQLSAYRDANPDVHAHAIAHLVTGRDMGNTNGIAYLNGACDDHRGVSLSDNSWGTLTAAQVMAHELGHNLGAPHDGEAGSACVATPQTFLMSPTVNGSGTFSACSLTQLSAFIASRRGSCIVSANYADVAVELPAGTTTADDGINFTLPVVLHSVGTIAATQVSFTATLPTGVSFQSAAAAGGSCSASDVNVVVCTFGSVPPGEDRTATLTLLGAQTGNSNVSVLAIATNDFLHGNDSASASVAIRSGTDVGVTMSASTTTSYVTDAVDFTFDVTAHRSHPAHGATLDVSLSAMDLESITAGSNTCAITLGAAFRCQLVDLAPGAHTTVTARARARVSGQWAQTAFVNVPNDGDSTNNNANVEMNLVDELGVGTQQTAVDFAVITGRDYVNTYTLTAVGRLPTTDVRFDVHALRMGTIVSVTPDTGTCANVGGVFPFAQFHCSFGTMAPGASHTVTVRFRMNSDGVDTLTADTIYWNGRQDLTWAQQAGIHAAPGVDIAIDAGAADSPSTGQTGIANVQVRSLGINAAQNVAITVDVPAQAQITNVEFANWTCTRPTSQRARCTKPSVLTSDGSAYMAFYYSSATAGQFTAHITATADADDVPANNTKDLVLGVLPFLDASMSTTSSQQLVIVGTPKTVNLTLTTGEQPVTGAVVTVADNPPFWTVTSLSAGSAACRAQNYGYSCQVGDLPGNASIPVVLQLNAGRSGTSGGTQVCVNITRDSDTTNNCVTLHVDTFGPTDARVSVAQATITATMGASFHYPLVTVTNGTDFAANAHVRIGIPNFASVLTVATSASGCTGTETLDCDFQTLRPNETATIDITLTPASPGTFTSAIELASPNDSTTGNNAASVAVRVDAAPSGSSSGGGSSSGSGSPGGGGGGGRIEWLGLAFLGLLAARRLRRRLVPGGVHLGPTMPLVGQQVRVAHERHVRPVR